MVMKGWIIAGLGAAVILGRSWSLNALVITWAYVLAGGWAAAIKFFHARDRPVTARQVAGFRLSVALVSSFGSPLITAAAAIRHLMTDVGTAEMHVFC